MHTGTVSKILLFTILITASFFFSLRIVKNNPPKNRPGFTEINYSNAANLGKMKLMVAASKTFIKSNHLNSRFFCFADMSLPSGKQRFFLFDSKLGNIVLAGLVTHGSGVEQQDTIQFSNKPGSNCSSPGRYKIGKPYFGKFGLAYKLYGLDKSNSNAFKRFVVLHAHACVPDEETAAAICMSWGCPTVSPAFLSKLKVYIDQADIPIMCWIFR